MGKRWEGLYTLGEAGLEGHVERSLEQRDVVVIVLGCAWGKLSDGPLGVGASVAIGCG